MNYRIVAHVVGLLALGFSAAFLAIIPFCLWYGDLSTLLATFKSIVVGSVVGGGLWYAGRGHRKEFFRREAIAVTALAWLMATFLGSLPFYFAGIGANYADCIFESGSGLTTTGASILTDFQSNPKALLFWRSMLQFVGGFGIIVFFVALMPSFAIGGKTLFKQEVAGHVVEGITPRIRDTALKLFRLYIGMWLTLVVCLVIIGGMTVYEAINHAMATVATGGFSPDNNSMRDFRPAAQWIVIIGMFLAGSNFVVHLEALRGNWRIYTKDTEFRVYGMLMITTSMVIAALLYAYDVESTQGGHVATWRDSVFTVISSGSTTGFCTADFDSWPGVARYLLIVITLIGGCVGGTSGGLKVIRLVILYRAMVAEIHRELSPRELRSLKVGRRPITPDVLKGVFGYLVVYGSVLFVGTGLFGLMEAGLTTEEAFTGISACFTSNGPGLGQFGPTGNYAELAPWSKLFLCLVMILGRLEVFPILLICSWRFWFPK